MLTALIPGSKLIYKALAVVFLLIGVLTYGYTKGISHERNKAAAKLNDQLVLAAKQAKAQQDSNNASYERLNEKYSALNANYRKIVKGVSKYASPSDTACVLSNGWVLLHDSATTGIPPEPPTVAEANPSGVTATEALETIAINYEHYNRCRQQVIEFNRWYEEQKKVLETSEK